MESTCPPTGILVSTVTSKGASHKCHKVTGLATHSHLHALTQADRESCKSGKSHSGSHPKEALTDIHKGSRSDTFSAPEVRHAETVIISVEYPDFCIKPSHNNFDSLRNGKNCCERCLNRLIKLNEGVTQV